MSGSQPATSAIASIVTLLSKDFIRLAFIATVNATPIAWYAMSKWLQDFVYRINIEWWVFALAGTLAVGIALLTVSFQSIKAALMDPVSSLRSVGSSSRQPFAFQLKFF